MPTLSRRNVLGAAGISSVALATPPAAADLTARGVHAGRSLLAYVGSRTTRQRNARGEGITVWRVAPDRDWELLQTVRADDADESTPTPGDAIPVNPSFLTMSREHSFLYAVHGDSTFVSAFAVDPSDGTLSLLNTVDAGRQNPVHLSIDPSGRWLVVAFLTVPSAVLVFPIKTDGTLGGAVSTLELPGAPGPHKTQQVGSNPHDVVFDPTGRWLVIADRGLDRVFVASLDADTGQLALNDPGWTQLRELEGPRHIAFNPRHQQAYLIGELRSSLTAFNWDPEAGVLTPTYVTPAHPPTMTGDTRGAEVAVAPSGRYVYASNRSGAGDSTPGGPGPDTIGIFRVGRRGHLHPVDWVSTRGIRPRFFGIDPTGRRLYVANEVTDTIVGYWIVDDGRRLRPMGVVARTGSPVCITWAPAPAEHAKEES
jgi:6-phosphogluconolactonase